MYAVLRPNFFAMQGLLQMLALPIKAGSDTGGAALPALGALSDVLEHVLAQQRGERGAEEQGEGSMHGAGTRWAASSTPGHSCCDVAAVVPAVPVVQSPTPPHSLSEPLLGKLLPLPKPCWRRPMAPAARREFAAAALEVLLPQVQPYAAAFQPPSQAAPSAPVQRSTHSPEGVPDALRQEAGG